MGAQLRDLYVFMSRGLETSMNHGWTYLLFYACGMLMEHYHKRQDLWFFVVTGVLIGILSSSLGKLWGVP